MKDATLGTETDKNKGAEAERGGGGIRACLLGEISGSRLNRCRQEVKNGETSEYLYRIRHVTAPVQSCFPLLAVNLFFIGVSTRYPLTVWLLGNGVGIFGFGLQGYDATLRHQTVNWSDFPISLSFLNCFADFGS